MSLTKNRVRSLLLNGIAGSVLAFAIGCDVEAAVEGGSSGVNLDDEDSGTDPGEDDPPVDAGETSTGAQKEDAGPGVLADSGGPELAADAAADAGPPVVPAPDPRKYKGAIVINNDYASIGVSVVNTKAKVLSEVFISAASTDPKLTQPFSSDVVLPNSDLWEDEVVLVDRSNSVLTWVDLESAEVRAQLDVGPGYDANPHDYARVSKKKAYVSRFADNGDPGVEDFDSGLDLLVIDPSKPAILGSVDLRSAMDEDETLPATPDRMIYAGGRVHVMISGLAPDFSDIAEARLVSVDVKTDEIVQVLKLKGMRNCTDLKLSPDETALAVACTGFFRQEPEDGWPDAGVVLIDVKDELKESGRFASDKFQHCAEDECQNTQINGLSFSSNDLLMVTTFGVTDKYPAQVFEVSLEGAETRALFEGGPFDLGAPACFAKACLVPSAKAGAAGLLKFDVEDGEFDPGKLKPVDETTGLPPRHVQRF